MKRKGVAYMLLSGCLALMLALSSCTQISTEGMVSVPMGGNAYETNGEKGAVINKEGLTHWDNENSVISTWFKTSRGGKLDLALRARSEASAELKMSVADKTFDVKIPAGDWAVIPVGRVTLPEGGVYSCRLAGYKERRRYFCRNI